MADITLSAAPVLGADISLGDNRIRERDDLAMVSVATPLGGADGLAAALQSAWALDMPSPTRASIAGDMWALPSAADQLMLVFPHATPDANAVVQTALSGAGYTTDQTDVWVVLEISGPQTLAALERLCLLDIHSFDTGDFARTMMEHMGAMILCLEPAYQLQIHGSSQGRG